MAALPKLIIITGATATGKSAFIYRELAGLKLNIINADSRQVYRHLRISSAGPDDNELRLFPHFLYHFQREQDVFSAGEYVRLAKAAIEQSRAEGRLPLICGGTYFYIQALLGGLLPPIEISDATRAKVDALSGEAAYALLLAKDAVAAGRIHPHNIYRVKRALMVCVETGRPMSSMERTPGLADDFDILMLIFNGEREKLSGQIAGRVDKMFSAGLVEEVAKVFSDLAGYADLTRWKQFPALTGIGVREFFELYEAEGVLPQNLSAAQSEQVRQNIIRNTQGLVKRQLTWFRNAPGKPANTKTVDPAYENARIATLVKEFLS
ncbi:MAG: tRNA (adenosine(37)-N6)-dimethylallyltransferase MiaA [Turneriella sp.]